MEALLAFFLMLVIISVATDGGLMRRSRGWRSASPWLFEVLIGGPVTGGSMNPARSLGPALFAGGGALAELLDLSRRAGDWSRRGREAVRGAARWRGACSGAPNDLFQALKEVSQTASDSAAGDDGRGSERAKVDRVNNPTTPRV